jgi:hypothetical protein
MNHTNSQNDILSDVSLSTATDDKNCEYPVAICAQLRWLQRRVFYQFLQTGCPTINLQANLDIGDNQADLRQRLAVPVPELRAMPPILRGSVKHAHPDSKHNRKPS